ncbi:MAG: ACP phosphodiesterase [Chitinophagaceae bacterium]
MKTFTIQLIKYYKPHQFIFINFLAHAYLSFKDPGILLGNMISDFVKGKKKFAFPPDIQKGIALHRAIDMFTDSNEATRNAKEIFRPHYRLYSGALVDVVYDHFLATDETEFTDPVLLEFSLQVYTTIDNYLHWLPEKFALMYPYMKEYNWLYNYHTRWGAEKSLQGVVRRAAYLNESETAFHLFEEHYQPLQFFFRQLWSDLKPFAYHQYKKLNIEDAKY